MTLNASNIDHSKPFTDEEKRFLHEWSLDHEIEVNERLHKQRKAHAKGEPVDVRGALDKAGVEPPPAPPNPVAVAGVGTVSTGAVVVEGENDVPPEPGSGGVVVPLPRDHPLTAVVDENRTDTVLPEAGGTQQGSDELTQETDEGKFDTRAVRKEVNELSVEELKDNLRDLEQPVSGNKDELQDRLVKALKKAHDEEQKAAE